MKETDPMVIMHIQTVKAKRMPMTVRATSAESTVMTMR